MTAFEEEPWEAEIGQLLGGLPAVDPPEGFIDRALDHRPLYAGRLLTGLMALTIIAVVGVSVTGSLGRGRVAPELSVLAERHDSVNAGTGLDLAPAPTAIETGVDMPAGFERTGDYAGDDLEFAIYERGDESISVIVQNGKADWESLPADGLTTIEGQRAWVASSDSTVVVQADGSVVTIIGLSAEEVGDVIVAVPRREPSAYDRVVETVAAVAGQLGFPNLE